MSMPIVVLRPEPGLQETCALALSLGIDTIAAPLFVIEPVDWQSPDPAHFDAILAGSANAFRHGGPRLRAFSGLPLHAVGERTAQEAREAGFRVASVGTVNLQRVLDALSSPQRLLRLAGEQRVALAPPPGMSIEELIVYRARPLPLSAEATAALRRTALVLLHSGEAARHFSGECTRLAVERSHVAIAALAPRIAEAAGAGWREVRIAPAPTDRALLVTARDMCQ